MPGPNTREENERPEEGDVTEGEANDPEADGSHEPEEAAGNEYEGNAADESEGNAGDESEGADESVTEEDDSEAQDETAEQGDTEKADAAPNTESAEASVTVKILIEQRGSTATIGVQRTDTDAHLTTVEAADVDEAISQVAAVLEEAEANWENSPKYAEHVRPAATPAAPKTGSKKATTKRASRETKPKEDEAVAGTERSAPAETQRAEPLALF